MEFTKTIDGNRMEVSPVGKLNAVTSPVFEKEVAELLEGIVFLTVDMSRVEYISSAGIRALLFFQQTLDEIDGKMIVKNVPPIVRQIFEVTGLTELIGVE